jgi:hypothetical protein
MEVNGMEITPDMYWVLILAGLVSLIIRFFYCNTIRKTLKLIAEENRHMQPREVWLAMIPIFTIYWNFKIAERMANSLTNEFFDRQIPEEENPGQAVGYSYSILFALGYIPISSGFVLVMGLFSFIFFIRYWLKISNFKALLTEHNRFIESNNQNKESKENTYES